MSGKGKRKDDQDYASDGDSEDHAPPKKFAKKDSDDSDGIVVCEISRNRRVSVRNWNGKIVVDIREFYMKDGKQLPGKKAERFLINTTGPQLEPSGIFTCISLSMDQWKVLRDHVEQIDKAVNED